MYYEEVSRAKCPVTLEQVKKYLKVTSSRDDSVIRGMIETAIRWGEVFTSRDFYEKVWKLYLDEFDSRIHLHRVKVSAVTSIEHLVDGVLTAVPITDYYLKKNTYNSEVLLIDGKSWPTNTDIREHAIEVNFTTVKSMQEEHIEEGVKQHVAYMYMNRGCGLDEAAKKSGAIEIYSMYEIHNV